MSKHNVLLVPGFFGFGSLGELVYFDGIRASLERHFERLRCDVNITEVVTLPTASLRSRAACVRETLASVARENEGPIHIIGHSTGGLDARLAISPSASLPTPIRFDAYDRLRSVVTVSCPHFGSPLATFFSSGSGRFLLRRACRAIIWFLKHGRIPLGITLRSFYFFLRLRDPFKKRLTTFDELNTKLLKVLTATTRGQLVHFFEAVAEDASLIFQLTPAGCDLLNAFTSEPRVRFGSVVTCAPPPSFRRFLRALADPYAEFAYPLYAFLHRLIAKAESPVIPEPDAPQRERLLESLGALPSERDNDGVVPTNSQIWGEVVHAAVADHLDVVGHYGAPLGGDWLPSQSQFDTSAFERLWSDVATFLLKSEGAEASANYDS